MGLFLALLLLLAVVAVAFGFWVVVAFVSVVVYAIFAIGRELFPVLLILAGVWLVWRAFAGGWRDRRRTRYRVAHAGHAGHASGLSQGWGAGQLQTPPQPGQQHHAAPHRLPQTAAIATPPPPAQWRELPIDVQIKAEQIRRKADMLLSYADRFPPFSQSLHIVRQTAADYLPRTLQAYLTLPGLSDPVVPTTGRTALTELRAQLHLLDARLDEITLDLQQQDLEKMSANRRFLEERFGLGAAAGRVSHSLPQHVLWPGQPQTGATRKGHAITQEGILPGRCCYREAVTAVGHPGPARPAPSQPSSRCH